MKKANFYKRLVAYMIDMFIVGLVISIISYNFDTTRLEKLSDKSIKLMNSFTNGDISSDKYFSEYTDILYKVNKANINSNLLSLVIYVGYFVLFQFFNGGATIGKKLLKIKVVSQGGGEVSLWQMVVRTSIINGIVPLALSLILIFTTSGLVFLTLSSIVGLFENIFVIICVFMLLYKSNCLALHDIMSKSVVIES